MKSKILSKVDRDNILDLVKNKAQSKWEESPLYIETEALHTKAEGILHEVQLAIIPDEDRKVLDRYGSGNCIERINFKLNSKDFSVVRAFGYNDPALHVTSYNVCGSPYMPEYPESESAILSLVHKTDPTILQRISELWYLRDCEEKAIILAYDKMLAECNTTKQVAENEALAKFLPKELLDYEPRKKMAALNKTDIALIAEMSA
jgi:hypothetical protein